MSTGSTKDYNFGAKNHWRRTIWNQLLQRSRRRAPGVFLYMAGPGDLDRKVATSKGVEGQQLIAVDQDPENVRRIRAMGHQAIEADIVSVLAEWPANRPIAGVSLDFCGGLTIKRAMPLTDVLVRQVFDRCPIAVNFQRGRESDFASLAGPGSVLLRDLPSDDAAAFFASAVSSGAKDPKNRAAIFFAGVALHAAIGTAQPWNMLLDRGLIQDVYKPSFFSYRSGGLVFDSVVYEPFAIGGIAQYTSVDVNQFESGIREEYGSDVVRRRLAAMFAWRTRRALR